MTAKVWLDKHIYNGTLGSSKSPHGYRMFRMQEAKAREQGLTWPLDWPTLCFLGLGPASIDLFVSMAKVFPELRLVVLELDEPLYLDLAARELGLQASEIDVSRLEDFMESRGTDRHKCDALHWSLDTPHFSFYRYREVFYSRPYILALYNLQGCNSPWKLDGVPTDRYYCEYQYQTFRATICGKVDVDQFAEISGQEVYFPTVASGCGQNLCFCHAHSDAFYDFNLEFLCKEGEPVHFASQWSQDYFLVHNVFGEETRGRGVYVDVGSSHPFHLSNTAFVDSCMGWRGLCLEPNPRLKHMIQGLRGCQVVDACAWANETTMKFANGLELAARTDKTELKPSLPGEISEDLWVSETFFEARCAPLHQLLLEGMAKLLKPGDLQDVLREKQRPRIDLISVDAEGAEMEIFRDFPFQSWDIRCIIVETSRRTSMALDSLFLPQGFVKVAVLGKDAIYLSTSQLKTYPITGQLHLPTAIYWNEPGSDSEFTDYVRFQRFFGLDGDLDEDVGDQRLLNESELERQAQRQEQKNQRSQQEALDIAQGAFIRSILSEEQKQLVHQAGIKEILHDPFVRKALIRLHQDPDVFWDELQASPRLKANVKQL